MTVNVTSMLLIIQFFWRCSTQSNVVISPDFLIHESSGSTLNQSRAVYGAKSCGAQGQSIQMRFEPCSSTNRNCRVPGDGVLRKCELDFIPSQNIKQLGIRLLLAPKGFEPQIMYEGIIPNSSVLAGNKYTLSGYGAITDEFKDSTVTTRHILFRPDSGRNEVCINANFDII